MLSKINIKKIQGNLKKFIFALRTDKDTQLQARQFALGLLVCFAIYWAGSTLLIDPKLQQREQLRLQLQEIKASSPEEVITTISIRKESLDKQILTLRDKVDHLTLQSNLLFEHWDQKSDSDRFNKILFSPQSPAPEDIVNNLKLMQFNEPFHLDGFKVLPVVIEGDVEFTDFYSYLQYLEGNSEVGTLQNLVIETLPADTLMQESKIHFSLVAGRIVLNQ
jgi:hypothetical protein